MGASQATYPRYPCIDTDKGLVFFTKESKGVKLTAKNKNKAIKMARNGEVPMYTASKTKAKRWNRFQT